MSFLKKFSTERVLLLMTSLSIIIVVVILLGALVYSVKHILGKSWTGALPPLSESQTLLSGRLEKHIQILAGDIGERNLRCYEKLEQAAFYIERIFEETGKKVKSQEFIVEGKSVRNLEVEITGTSSSDEIIVIGAHYDTVEDCPGANDNGSGIAALLEINRILSGSKPSRTLRLVAFVNEEPPFFKSSSMGSLVYARQARKKNEKIIAMFSLETIGFYSDEDDSQKFPFPPLRFAYPTTGNFIAFVTSIPSQKLLRQSLTAFRRNAAFPSEGLVAPGWLTGIDWSDHWSFWEEDYPGVMITDTAPFRYQHYHSPSDTPDKLCYPEMARVVDGISHMIAELARAKLP